MNKRPTIKIPDRFRLPAASLISEICDLIESEHTDHNTCDYDIGCIMSSQQVWGGLQELLDKHATSKLSHLQAKVESARLNMTDPIAIKLEDCYLSPPVGEVHRKVWNAAIDYALKLIKEEMG